MNTIKTVNLDIAQQLLDIGISKAKELQSPSNIAIADAYGYLLAHVRMDQAQLPSIEHSINKAYTSALFQKPTHELKEPSEPKGELYGLNQTLNQRVIVFAGGVPLFLNEHVVGAVGVSGGTAEQDQSIAQAIADHFNQTQEKSI